MKLVHRLSLWIPDSSQQRAFMLFVCDVCMSLITKGEQFYWHSHFSHSYFTFSSFFSWIETGFNISRILTKFYLCFSLFGAALDLLIWLSTLFFKGKSKSFFMQKSSSKHRTYGEHKHGFLQDSFACWKCEIFILSIFILFILSCEIFILSKE